MVEEENSSPLYVKKEGGGHVQYLREREEDDDIKVTILT